MCSICNAGTLLASVQARIYLTDCCPVVMTGFVNSLFYYCWKEIFGNWDEKTEFTRDIVWADSERRQTKLFVGAFIGDQQVFRIDAKRFDDSEICRF